MPSRRTETSGAARARSAGDSRPGTAGWRRVQTKPRRRRRVFALGITGLSFLFFGGLFLWALFWLWPPRPACLFLVGAGYETNLAIPHNVYGRNGLNDLEALTRFRPESVLWRSKRLSLHQEARTLRTRGAWDQGIETCPEKTVVLFLALHGGSDARGAFLLANDADIHDDPPNARDSHRRLRLPAVLDALRKVPMTKNKVLVLDATQVTASWPLGILHNDFARQLEQLDEQIARIPNLVVLSASSADERSWVSEEWRQTIFTHYLVEGLKGAARDTDGRVHALGLFQFARRNVENWVVANRQARQTPVLLPRGPEGVARARRIELAVSRKRYEAPDPARLAEFEVPGALWSRWETYDRLRTQVPAPSVYTPHLWCRYQATLVRFEELERAGDRTSAKTMQARLSELERAIAEAGVLALRSSQNTLDMSAAAGRVLPKTTESLQLRFNELWSAPPEEYAKRWEQMQIGPGAPPKSEAGRVRVQLLDFLRNRAADGAAEDLKKAALLARVLDEPAHPRAAEVHDLVMLQRDLPAELPRRAPGLIPQSIAVRRRAEATALDVLGTGHPYAEQVVPWVRGLLDQADEERRLGQDLLFASDAPSWAEAARHFEQAERSYRRAGDDASVVRSALQFRDEALSILPDYALWLASDATQRALAYQDPKDRSVEEMEALWGDLHTLVRALEHPDRRALPDLRARLETLRTRFASVERRLEETAQRLVRKGESPTDWRALAALLRVPFVLPQEDLVDGRPLRLLALDKQRELGRRFLTAFEPEKTHPPTLSPEQDQADARDNALRQGRLALAVLGADWFDACPPSTAPGLGPDEFPDKFATVRARLLSDTPGPSARAPLPLVGERIAHRWRQLPQAVAEAVGELNRQARQRTAQSGPPTQSSPSKGEAWGGGAGAIHLLRRADRLTRLLDGSGAEQLELELKRLPPSFLVREPESAFRKLLVQALLIAQARRTLDDHWYADDPDAPPYYQTVGLTYLDDAEKLDPLGLRRAEIEDGKHRLTKPDGLRLSDARPGRSDAPKDDGGPDVIMTSELHLDVPFVVARAPGATPRRGFPVFWPVPEGPDDPLERVAPVGDDRLVRRVGAETVPRIPTRWVSRLKPEDGPQVHHGRLALEGRFRGQVLKHVTTVDLYPLAETVAARHLMPEAGGIAVRASDDLFRQFAPSNGAVAIVLDCSGSMGVPKGEIYGPTTKYKQATDALETLLRGLPPGTIISLWVFGPAAPEYATVEAEDTIRQMLKPTAWTPNLLDGVMASIRYPKLEPWNRSPVVRTMWRAKRALLDAPGFKTLLVITDGSDDRFEHDPVLNREQKPIPVFLHETFADTGISVNVLAVSGPIVGAPEPTRTKRQDELTLARHQFEVIQDFPVAGKFTTVENAQELADKLREALRQNLSYRILAAPHTPIPGTSNREVNVSRVGANDQWFPGPLLPGGYIIQLLSDKRRTKSFELNRGDLLPVILTPAPEDEIAFGRAQYSQEYFPNNVEGTLLDEPGQWRFSVLQNQRREGNAVRMLVTLEKQPDPRETTLALVRPRELWIEVEPDSKGPLPLSLRWDNREHYPAPTWTLSLKNWPTTRGTASPARPRVRAWWNPDLETLRSVPLQRGKQFQIDAPDEVRPVIQVDGGDVVIEGVRIEKHRVQVAANVTEEKTCLVIRLTHPPGRPVWVRLPGIDAAGVEHRFYAAPGKYTGLFWTKTEDEVKNSVTVIDLIALERFKEACEVSKHHVELNRLAPPRSDSPAPPEFGAAR